MPNRQANEFLKEGGKLRFRHLARCNLEFPVSYPAPSHGVALNFHVEGWVGDDHLGHFSAKQPLVIITTEGISAHQMVAAELPPIAHFADCGPGQRKTGSIVPGRPSKTRSISPVVKPVNSTSKSISIRSLKCPRRTSKSQTARSGRRLSAIKIARFSPGLRPVIVTVGTSLMPSRFAASS